MTDQPTQPNPVENRAAAPPSAEAPLFAVMGEFENVDDVVAAAVRLRDAGFSRWDVHSPFPIHHIDQYMGMKRSNLPLLALGGGLAGFGGGTFLVWWTNATDFTQGLWPNFEGYPYFISGKPIFSYAANIPIVFETTILLAAFGAFFGMLALNRLPMLYHPLFKSRRFRRVTDDRFFVVIDADDPHFDARETPALLEQLGATAVEEVRD